MCDCHDTVACWLIVNWLFNDQCFLDVECFLPHHYYSTYTTTGPIGQSLEVAIKVGCRLIDCASMYENEAEIGDVLQKCLIEGVCKRQDLFITSKLWYVRKSSQTLVNSVVDVVILCKLHAHLHGMSCRVTYKCMFLSCSSLYTLCSRVIDLFSTLPFKKILLSVLCYLLVELNASKVIFYVQRVVQTEQFKLVPVM